MTIIKLNSGTKEFPIIAIKPDVLELFEIASNHLSKIKKDNAFQSIIRTLECFLQLTNQTLNLKVLNTDVFAQICVCCVGSMLVENFYDTTDKRKYSLVTYFWSLAKFLEINYYTYPLPCLKFKTNGLTTEAQACIDKFNTQKLDEEKIKLWQAWPSINKSGTYIWLPLYPIYMRLGKEFTDNLYQACCLYVSSREVTRLVGIKEFSYFIEQYAGDIRASDFKNPVFMGRFWRLFLNYYLVTKWENGSQISTIIKNWRVEFLPFVKTYLIPDIFAETYGEIPAPPVKSTVKGSTNIRVLSNGSAISEKLITPIPLEVTDDEAIKLLFEQIKSDVNIATNWAQAEIEDLWKRYNFRKEHSQTGQILQLTKSSIPNGKRWLTDRKNPDHLKHASATFNYYKHLNAYDAGLLLPKPIEQTAFELGQITTGALLPHCVMLVANHPSITPSFLENLTLFDKNGKLTGFIKTDGTYKLVGIKKRKGAKLAPQIISLNEKTTEVVKQMIELTSMSRNLLKDKGSDEWRYLLLTCKQGFSFPTRIKRLTTDTSSKQRVDKFVKSLEKTCKLDLEQRKKYAKQFSLVSLRASSAVLVYLETRSIDEMSKALGHTVLDPNLIKRYLPAPILNFFQERWIRIFQTAFLVEALKDSKYLLEASGFNNITELDAFLITHTLNIPTNKLDDDKEPQLNKIGEVVFGINAHILTLLLSLQRAVENTNKSVNGFAKYWAEISQHLIEHIKNNESHRPDLMTFLEHAHAHANPAIMEKIIHA